MPLDDVLDIRDVKSLKDRVSPEEWRVRVDLAACYRLVCHYGWNSGIFNHAAARIPGEPDKFLIKPHAILWEEVTASNLIKVAMEGELDESAGVNRPGYVLHSAILRARPDVQATLHIHPQACIAVASTADGLLPLTQDAIRFHDRIGYHGYEGITEDADERERIVAHLGPHPALLMRSHGATTVGPSVRHAFILMRGLINACEIQLRLMASGAELVVPDAATCERTAAQMESHDKGRGQADWPGFLRMLDRADPGYRD